MFWGRSWERLLPRTEVGLGLSALSRGPGLPRGRQPGYALPTPCSKSPAPGRQPTAAMDRPAQDGVGPASSCEWSRVGALGIGLLA